MSVILWSLTTGDCLRTLLGHKAEISSLEFSEDGLLLTSRTSDRRAIVWDVASGNVLSESNFIPRHIRNPTDVNEAPNRPYSAMTVGGDKWRWVATWVDMVMGVGVINKDSKIYAIWAEDFPCQLPPGYRVDTFVVLQDRAVFLCTDGRVLIVDTSRMGAESR